MIRVYPLDFSPLVYERRMNRNRLWKGGKAQSRLADEHDQDYNQVRTAKIWSEFDRKYLTEKYRDQVKVGDMNLST